MRIIITEEQKKKLFIPRKIDDRKEQLNQEIKKFLTSIKDSKIWEIISKIEYSNNYETGWEEISYFDENDKLIDVRIAHKDFLEKFGKDTGGELIKYIENVIVYGFMSNILTSGEDVTYSVNEIINHGNGKLEYKEHREIRVEESNYRVVSI